MTIEKCDDALKISVIIPVYNSAAYLERSVSSVLSQDYPNVEVIIVDDGSRDYSANLCERIAKKDNRIRVYHKEHMGQLHSRIYGIQKSTGDYIMFLDSDDYYTDSTVSTVVKYISKYGVDLLMFGFRKMKDGVSMSRSPVVPESPLLITDKRELYRKTLGCGRYSSVWCKAINKKIIKETDDSAYYSLRQSEDLLQSVAYYQNAGTALIVNDVLYNYCSNPLSVSNDFSIKNIQDAMAVRQYVETFLQSENVFSEDDFQLYYQSCAVTAASWTKKLVLSDIPNTEKKEILLQLRTDPFLARLLKMKDVVRRVKFEYRLVFSLFFTSSRLMVVPFCVLSGILLTALKERRTAQDLSVVSVIVPVYNCDCYLPKCINSLLKQTHKSLQIILVDDGSTDKSGEICDRSALKDARIQVIHQPNGGVSSARNAGLEVASGEYVTFVDADDWLTRDAVEKLLKKMEKESTDFCFGAYRLIKPYSIYTYNRYHFDSSPAGVALSDFFGKIRDFNSGNAKLFRYDILKKNNIRFRNDMQYGEDAVFVLDYLACCRSVSYCSSVVYYYSKIVKDNACSKYYPQLNGWRCDLFQRLFHLQQEWELFGKKDNETIARLIVTMLKNLCRHYACFLSKSDAVNKYAETYELWDDTLSFIEQTGFPSSHRPAAERLIWELYDLFKAKEFEAVYARLSGKKTMILRKIRMSTEDFLRPVERFILYKILP